MAEKIFVESKYLRAKFGHGIDYGYTSIPNIILDHAFDLGLSDKATYFIIQVLRAQDKKRNCPDSDRLITDKDLKMKSSAKTLERIRKEFKGLLDPNGNNLIITKSFYQKNEDSGKVAGAGTFYDFQPMIDYILENYYKEEPDRQNDVSDTEYIPHGESPTSQNDVSVTEPTRQNGFVPGQNVQEEPYIPEKTALLDKMTDINKELKNNKNYKNIQGSFFNLLKGRENLITKNTYELLLTISKLIKDDTEANINYGYNKLTVSHKHVDVLRRYVNQFVYDLKMYDDIDIEFKGGDQNE